MSNSSPTQSLPDAEFARSLPFWPRTALLFPLLLLASLAVYHKSTTGWGDRSTFKVYSATYEMGCPRWLTYNDVSTSGNVPPLPDSRRAESGIHVHFPMMVIAVVFTFVAALLLSAAIYPLRRQLSPKLILLLSIYCPVAVAFAVRFDSDMALLVCFAIVVPLGSAILAACFRSQFIAVFSSLMTAIITWVAFRFMAVLSDLSVPDAFSSGDALICSVVFFPTLIVSAIAIFVSSRIAHNKAVNPSGG